MLSFLKLCLKSILSYSESFETHLFLGENWLGTPIPGIIARILQILKIFTSVYTFQEAKNIFFPKVTQIWLSTRKKNKK